MLLSQLPIMQYLQEKNISDYSIHYAYTSQWVLQALENGEAKFGIFALHNNTGWIVQESLTAMAQHSFTIIEHLALKIEHMIMKRKDCEEINQFMAHPQVLVQCKQKLAKQ